MQALIKDRGGTVETYFLGRQPASCTVSVFDSEGSLKVDEATCLRDSVSTSLSSSAVEGDRSLSLASSSGIIPGWRYLLGDEAVTVKSITGATVTLWAPLARDHASGTTFKGLRVWCDVPSDKANAYWWDGYAVFTPDSGEPQTESVDCVRRMIPYALIDEVDIRDVIPKASLALSVELDLPRAFRQARDRFLVDIGGRNRAHTMLGVDHFRRPCALMFWLMRAFEFGAEYAEQFDRLQARYDELKKEIIAQTPVDTDQDGTTSGPDDRTWGSARVFRA